MGKTATKANKHKHLQMMVTWELIAGKDIGLVLHAAFNTGSVICYIVAVEMGETATKANKHKHLQMMVTWELIAGKDIGLVLKEHIQLYRRLIKQVCPILPPRSTGKVHCLPRLVQEGKP